MPGVIAEKVRRRFETRFVRSSGCWQWTGGKDNDGYGMFWLRGTNVHASRASYEIYTAPVPRSKQVCHRCDNPGCVNPDHLFLGTQKENVQDSIRKGRRIRNRKIIDEKMARKIHSLIVDGLKSREISESLSVSIYIANDIRSGRTWRLK